MSVASYMLKQTVGHYKSPKNVELYIELVFSGRYQLVFLGIYHTDTKENLGRYILVSFFWREPLFPSKRGHWPPF